MCWFLLSFLPPETHRTVLNQILRQSTTHLADGPFAVLVDYIRVLDFDVKRKYVPWCWGDGNSLNGISSPRKEPKFLLGWCFQGKKFPLVAALRMVLGGRGAGRDSSVPWTIIVPKYSLAFSNPVSILHQRNASLCLITWFLKSRSFLWGNTGGVGSHSRARGGASLHNTPVIFYSSLPSCAPTHAYLLIAEIPCHNVCGPLFDGDGKNLELVVNDLPLPNTGGIKVSGGWGEHHCGSSS